MITVLNYQDRRSYISQVKELKTCFTCKHIDDTGGIYRCRRHEVTEVKVHDVISGVENKPSTFVIMCHEERYSTYPERCGLEGQFWEAYDKTK